MDTSSDIECNIQIVRSVMGEDAPVIDLYCCYEDLSSVNRYSITTIKAMRIDTPVQHGYIIIEPSKKLPNGKTLTCLSLTYVPDYTLGEDYEYIGGYYVGRTRQEAAHCVKKMYMKEIEKHRAMERYYTELMYQLA